MTNEIRFSSIVVVVIFLMVQLLLQGEAIRGRGYDSKPTTYMVGDEEGWDLSIDMESWTKGKNFHAGDILVFKYDDRFDVALVNKEGHDSCRVNPGAQVYDSGDDRIRLSFGANYFIDSESDVCAAGMKMAINATAPPPSLFVN